MKENILNINKIINKMNFIHNTISNFVIENEFELNNNLCDISDLNKINKMIMEYINLYEELIEIETTLNDVEYKLMEEELITLHHKSKKFNNYVLYFENICINI